MNRLARRLAGPTGARPCAAAAGLVAAGAGLVGTWPCSCWPRLAALLLLAEPAAPPPAQRPPCGNSAQLEDTGVDETHLARGLEDLLRRYAVARFGRERWQD